MLEEKERVKDTNYQNLSRQNDTGIAVYHSVSQGHGISWYSMGLVFRAALECCWFSSCQFFETHCLRCSVVRLALELAGWALVSCFYRFYKMSYLLFDRCLTEGGTLFHVPHANVRTQAFSWGGITPGSSDFISGQVLVQLGIHTSPMSSMSMHVCFFLLDVIIVC